MKLTILCDNNTFIDNYLLGEPALSFYIENGNDKILFDLGYSNVYIKNAKKLSIDISQVNKIVFSHGHNDHTRGLKYINPNKQLKIYAGQGCFDLKHDNITDISAPYREPYIAKNFDLKICKTLTKISENLYFLGTIPRTQEHEKENANLFAKDKNGVLRIDKFTDDSALVFEGKDGLTIISGCSHSGICNITEYALQCFKNKKVNAIIGGFHLMQLNQSSLTTIKYFKDKNISTIYPCHCTCFDVKCEMKKQGLNLVECGSGLILNFE